MPRMQMWAVIALVAVFSWSVIMAALGQVSAIATLVPSLGLLVQQTIQALAGSGEPGRRADLPPAAKPRKEHVR